MFDYHTHSDFSSDADHPMESMVLGAIALDLQEIAVTDHIDYDYADPSIDFDVDHASYRLEIRRLQERYGDQITLRHGLELGLQPHLMDRYTMLVAQEKPDFVLCSIHTCCRMDLYRGDFYRNRTPAEAWENYLHELHTIVQGFKAYSVLGHLDILRRYNADAAAFPKTSLKHGFMAIFKELILNGKGLEVNTSGYRNPDGMPMPSWELLKWYQEAGGEILTLGSDAHSPDLLAYRFPETLETLRELGFKSICTFEAMEPTFHAIG